MKIERITIVFALILLLPTGCVIIGSPSTVEGQNPGECSDDADNDADGLYDCDDPDCSGSDACSGDDDDSTGDDDDSAGDDDDSAGDDDDSAGDDDDSAGDDDDSAGDDDDSTPPPNPCSSQPLDPTNLELDLNFEDGAGSLAVDNSSHGRDAVLSGSPVWDSGYCGGGLSFDGVDDWALVSGVLGAHTAGSVTLEAWVWIPTAAPWSSGVPHILTGGTENNYRLSLNNNGTGRIFGQFETVNPGGSLGVIERAIYTPNPFPAGVWTHLALTYGPEFVTTGDHIVRLFVNGNEEANNVADNPTMPLLAATDLEIAAWNQFSNSFFEGKVDDVRVWSMLRGPIEICEDGRGTFNGSSCVY